MRRITTAPVAANATIGLADGRTAGMFPSGVARRAQLHTGCGIGMKPACLGGERGAVRPARPSSVSVGRPLASRRKTLDACLTRSAPGNPAAACRIAGKVRRCVVPVGMLGRPVEPELRVEDAADIVMPVSPGGRQAMTGRDAAPAEVRASHRPVAGSLPAGRAMRNPAPWAQPGIAAGARAVGALARGGFLSCLVRAGHDIGGRQLTQSGNIGLFRTASRID